MSTAVSLDVITEEQIAKLHGILCVGYGISYDACTFICDAVERHKKAIENGEGDHYDRLRYNEFCEWIGEDEVVRRELLGDPDEYDEE